MKKSKKSEDNEDNKEEEKLDEKLDPVLEFLRGCMMSLYKEVDRLKEKVKCLQEENESLKKGKTI